LGFDFRRPDHRDRHSGSAAASLDDHQHPRGELSVERPPQGRTGPASRTGAGRGFSLLGLGLCYAQNAPKGGAGLHCVRGQGGPFMNFRGGEFSSGVDRVVIYAYQHHVRLLLPSLWSLATSVYSGRGADIVMQSTMCCSRRK
jgi:hypothetical protein